MLDKRFIREHPDAVKALSRSKAWTWMSMNCLNSTTALVNFSTN